MMRVRARRRSLGVAWPERAEPWPGENAQIAQYGSPT